MVRATQLSCSRLPGGRGFRTGLGHSATGNPCLFSSQCTPVPNQGRIRQQKDRDGHVELILYIIKYSRTSMAPALVARTRS